MPTTQTERSRGTFFDFYRGVYADDHATLPNRAFHMVGTFGGLALLIASVTIIPLWWALAFPIVHAVPGLIGHRLFERNPELGDVRVFNGSYPGLWFMAANHLRAGEWLWGLVSLGWLRK